MNKEIVMARFFKKRDEAHGEAPGSMVFIGKKKIENPRIRLIQYDDDNLSEHEPKSLEELVSLIDNNMVNWINIDGLHDVDLMSKLKNAFDLHPLLVEDVMSTAQRPKFEEFDNCLFIAQKMLDYDKKQQLIRAEQFSLVLKKGVLITFQEQVGDVFEPVRDRIRKKKGRVRSSGPDYLAYALLDTIVDNYVAILEDIGVRIEELEDSLLKNPEKQLLELINVYKREIGFMSKVIKPVKEIALQWNRDESGLTADSTFQFINDFQDLVVHTTETLETYRDLLSDYLNLYHTSVSNKMNEIMKVLTIFAAIFIPLTFIAGIYGTNFDYLPELHYKYSYAVFWGVIITLGLGMVIAFKKRKWF